MVSKMYIVLFKLVISSQRLYQGSIFFFFFFFHVSFLGIFMHLIMAVLIHRGMFMWIIIEVWRQSHMLFPRNLTVCLKEGFALPWNFAKQAKLVCQSTSKLGLLNSTFPLSIARLKTVYTLLSSAFHIGIGHWTWFLILARKRDYIHTFLFFLVFVSLKEIF